MMKRVFGSAIFLAVLVLLAGCRIGVSVFQGGDVLSASGERNCLETRNCEFTVDSASFTETFTAQPRNGFVFTRWRAGEGFLCANSTSPVCTVNLAGVPGAESIVASDAMSYLVPEFTCAGNCRERPDVQERGLDEALVALYEAADVIEAYVAANDGHGASHPSMYGINLGTTGSTMLRDLDIYPQDTSGGDYTFYIIANVFRRVWGDTENPWAYSSFALSGQTNGDNSMTWDCIPRDPTPPPETFTTIPFDWLPLFCRL